MIEDEDFKKIAEESSRFAWYIILFLGLMLTISITTVAFSNPANCPVFADMALTSKAMALESVDKDKAKKVIIRMYQPAHARAEAAMYMLVDMAYADKNDLQTFMEAVYRSCMTAYGNPNFLGTRV